MGPAGPVQRLTVGEGVKKKSKKKCSPYIFKKKEKKKKKWKKGGWGIYGRTHGEKRGRGVEGQTEELKIGTLLKESVKGKWLVERTARRGCWQSWGATGGQRRRRTRSSKHLLISHKSQLNSSHTNSETEEKAEQRKSLKVALK